MAFTNRVALCVCIATLLPFEVAVCQLESAGLPRFEVASMKPWVGGGPIIRGRGSTRLSRLPIPGYRFRGRPSQLLQLAFDVKPY